MTKRKHPQDRAERLRINEEHDNKKGRKYAKTMDTQGIEENLDASTYTISTTY